MICPIDQEPCTGDHSMRCYSECAQVRSLRPGPFTHTVDPDPSAPWMTIGKPKKYRRPSVIGTFIRRLTWKDWVIIWCAILVFNVGRVTAHILWDDPSPKIINCTKTDQTYRCTIKTVAP